MAGRKARVGEGASQGGRQLRVDQQLQAAVAGKIG
jgi:hypothetical protein